MEGRYESNNICQISGRSLYSPVYDDLLERRAAQSDRTVSGMRIRKYGTRRKKSVLSGDAVSFYRKKLIQLLAAAVIVTFIFGAVGVHADTRSTGGRSTDEREDEFVYQVITVECGDTLWDIADTWAGSTGDDIRTYMDNICEMNRIQEDDLKEGQLLLIYHGKSKVLSGNQVAEW